jgi:hypothetical protein
VVAITIANVAIGAYSKCDVLLCLRLLLLATSISHGHVIARHLQGRGNSGHHSEISVVAGLVCITLHG